jgi:hypothetical protein
MFLKAVSGSSKPEAVSSERLAASSILLLTAYYSPLTCIPFPLSFPPAAQKLNNFTRDWWKIKPAFAQ